jgi:hypothetical protein
MPGQDGGVAEWISVGPSGDVTYRMQQPRRGEVVLRLGQCSTYHGFVQPHLSRQQDPAAAAAAAAAAAPAGRAADDAGARPGAAEALLPQLRLPTTDPHKAHEWILTPQRVLQPPSTSAPQSSVRRPWRPFWRPLWLRFT